MKLLIVTLCVACCAADVSHVVGKSEKDAEIIQQSQDLGPDGSYQWGFETNNGIQASASGSIVNPETENAGQVVQGSSKWTSPEGEVVEISYTADENGYNAQGSHIPTPPAIPAAIIKALEYIRAHPPPPENIA